MDQRVNFRYAPPSGDISGKSVLEQTERAINELGEFIDEIDVTADEAVTISQAAQAAATNAEATAAAAATDAANALTSAQSAQNTASDALASASEAVTTANSASDRADNALSIANAAQSSANSAITSAEGAEIAANEANEAANNAQITAGNAVSIAEGAAGIFRIIEGPDDTNEYVTPDKVFFPNPEDIQNLPVVQQGYLVVFVRSDGSSAYQAYTLQETPEIIYSRSVKKIGGSSDNYEFGIWKQIGDLDSLPVVSPGAAGLAPASGTPTSRLKMVMNTDGNSAWIADTIPVAQPDGTIGIMGVDNNTLQVNTSGVGSIKQAYTDSVRQTCLRRAANASVTQINSNPTVLPSGKYDVWDASGLGLPGASYQVLHYALDNSPGFAVQIAYDFYSNEVYVRNNRNGLGAWVKQYNTPIPTATSGLGQFFYVGNSNLILPAGGTWAYFILGISNGGPLAAGSGGIVAGGTNIGTGQPWHHGFAWRIA